MYDSRVNKSGIFESNQLLGSFIGSSIGRKTDTVVTLQCRYEFEAQKPERIQIRFHDFNVPTERENSSRCHEEDALHVLAEVRGKYETQELLCGAFLPKPLMSSAQRMQLQFVGKYPPQMTNKVQYYGFRAEYKFLTSKGSQIMNIDVYRQLIPSAPFRFRYFIGRTAGKRVHVRLQQQRQD